MLNKTVNSYKHPQLHERKAVLSILKTLYEYFYGGLRFFFANCISFEKKNALLETKLTAL